MLSATVARFSSNDSTSDFRFCGWRGHVCFVEFARWRHRRRSLPSPSPTASCFSLIYFLTWSPRCERAFIQCWRHPIHLSLVTHRFYRYGVVYAVHHYSHHAERTVAGVGPLCRRLNGRAGRPSGTMCKSAPLSNYIRISASFVRRLDHIYIRSISRAWTAASNTQPTTRRRQFRPPPFRSRRLHSWSLSAKQQNSASKFMTMQITHGRRGC